MQQLIKTTIMNNNSQDLYAEVSDVTMASGLLSTFHTQQPGLQNQFSDCGNPFLFLLNSIMHNYYISTNYFIYTVLRMFRKRVYI